MNYLERLISRALARTPTRSGEPLADPFEVVVPWPLDAPAPRPRPRDPEPPSVTVLATPPSRMAHSSPIRVREIPAVPVAPRLTTGPAAEDGPALPAGRSPLADRSEPPASSPPIRPAARGADPLGQADAFMRSLGVRFPEGPAPLAPGSRVDAVAPTSATPEAPVAGLRPAAWPPLGEEPRPLNTPSLAPPQVARPLTPPPAPMPTPAPPARNALPKSSGSPERPESPPPASRPTSPAPTPPPTLVVRPAAPALSLAEAALGGASRLGIGQL